MLRTECLRGASIPPPGSAEAITFSCESESWLLTLSMLIIDPPPQDQQCQSPPCRSPLHQSSIAFTSIIDPPRIKFQSPPHWSPLCWSLITSTSIIDPPRINNVDCLYTDRRSPLRQLSIDPPTFLIFNIRIMSGWDTKVVFTSCTKRLHCSNFLSQLIWW